MGGEKENIFPIPIFARRPASNVKNMRCCFFSSRINEHPMSRAFERFALLVESRLRNRECYSIQSIGNGKSHLMCIKSARFESLNNPPVLISLRLSHFFFPKLILERWHNSIRGKFNSAKSLIAIWNETHEKLKTHEFLHTFRYCAQLEQLICILES